MPPKDLPHLTPLHCAAPRVQKNSRGSGPAYAVVHTPTGRRAAHCGIAREICERTVSSAVVESLVDRLGSRYVLGLKAQKCGTDGVLPAEQAQVEGKEDVADALRRMAGRLRALAVKSPDAFTPTSPALLEAATSSSKL